MNKTFYQEFEGFSDFASFAHRENYKAIPSDWYLVLSEGCVAKGIGKLSVLQNISGVQLIRPLPMSPNLNAYAERFVRTIKEECLSQLILFGEKSLRRTLRAFLKHYHEERNHQGKGNRLLFPTEQSAHLNGSIRCRESLGGMLTFYHRQAA